MSVGVRRYPIDIKYLNDIAKLADSGSLNTADAFPPSSASMCKYVISTMSLNYLITANY